MEATNKPETGADRHDPSPLSTPPARTRDWSADDLEVDIADPNLDLTFDDENRLEDDAHPERD